MGADHLAAPRTSVVRILFKAIRNAINRIDKLKNRSLTVFPHGSYRNRVNVRQDSDVDVGVLCDESFFLSPPRGDHQRDFWLFCPSRTTATFSLRMNSRKPWLCILDMGLSVVGTKPSTCERTHTTWKLMLRRSLNIDTTSENGNYLCGMALSPDNGGHDPKLPRTHTR